MTSVILYGKIKRLENIDDVIYIEVERSYKDQNGIIKKDLIPCKYWSKNKKNLLFNLYDNTSIIIKGRIEEEDKLVVIVEEFKAF